jgi:hypothetical protein
MKFSAKTPRHRKPPKRYMGLPILFALYTKKKEHKTILLIIGLILIGWTVYENFIKSA